MLILTLLFGVFAFWYIYIDPQTCFAMVQETPHLRSYFYIGGQYTNTPAGHVFQDQMYVEHLTPIGGCKQRYPIIFIHGGAQTGTVRVPNRPWHISLSTPSLATP